MKRLIIIMFALGIVSIASAQSDSTCADTAIRHAMRIDLGLSASATMYGDGNDLSPYYSKYGFGLHLPLMAHYDLSPNWTLAAGLQYDFIWSPLYYRVESTADGNGIDFPTTPQQGTQHSHAFHGYIGMPFKITWSPYAKRPNTAWLAIDVHPAYAVTRYFSLTNTYISRNGTSVSAPGDEEVIRGTSLMPWKLEVGLTLGTSRVGLIHGLRFFGNLLPTYKDAVTGEKIHTVGVTFFF